jgi:5'(3')-deoxyribonucleotidase
MKQILKEWRKFITEEKRKINIFLDMDGVLVDFPSALKAHIKEVYFAEPETIHPDSKSSRRALRQLQQLQLNDEKIEELYDRSEYKFQSGEDYKGDEKLMSNYVLKALLKNKALWLQMDKLKGADALVNEVFDIADEVFVLSAQVDRTSEEAKKEWIERHFGQIDPVNVHIDRNKGGRLLQLISQGTVSESDLNILIDDRQKFLDSFMGAGGMGIRYNYESPQNAIGELKALIGN